MGFSNYRYLCLDALYYSWKILHKLSRPWYGPYRFVARRDPDVTVVKVYFMQDGYIEVHQTRVAPCSPELLRGFFWYESNMTDYPRGLIKCCKVIPSPNKMRVGVQEIPHRGSQTTTLQTPIPEQMTPV